MDSGNPTKHFFIGGLPRSRTTWLANWLTAGEVFCHHEPLQHVRSFEDLDLGVSGARVVGCSDASLSFCYDELSYRYPGCRLIIIDRAPDQCLSSLRRAGIPCDPASFDALVRQHHKFCDRFPADVVPFERLNEPDVLARLWNHFTFGTIPHNEPRTRALLSMNVQPHLPTSLPMWQENASNLAELMLGKEGGQD